MVDSTIVLNDLDIYGTFTRSDSMIYLACETIETSTLILQSFHIEDSNPSNDDAHTSTAAVFQLQVTQALSRSELTMKEMTLFHLDLIAPVLLIDTPELPKKVSEMYINMQQIHLANSAVSGLLKSPTAPWPVYYHCNEEDGSDDDDGFIPRKCTGE